MCRKCKGKTKLLIAKDSRMHFAKEVCGDCNTLHKFVSRTDFYKNPEIKSWIEKNCEVLPPLKGR